MLAVLQGWLESSALVQVKKTPKLVLTGVPAEDLQNTVP